jgi:hypothetical protein
MSKPRLSFVQRLLLLLLLLLLEESENFVSALTGPKHECRSNERKRG